MPPKKRKFTGSTRMKGFNSTRKIWNSKGDEHLSYYCQMCEKQCRDYLGFNTHCTSEFHQKQMKTFAENVDYYINKFSSEFHSQFLKILSTSFQTRRVLATEVYEQLIDNRDHTHLNATRWGELTEYVMHLGKSGICRVDQKPEGWYIAWIDKSLTVMDKEMAKEKKQRIQVTEEERDRIAIRQQISKAAAAVLSEIRPGEITGASPTILLKSADEPIKLSLIPSSSSKPGFKPMSKKANPLSSKK